MRVEGPWCPSAADVKLRVWSLPLGGPRESASMSFSLFSSPSLFFLSPFFLMGSLFLPDSVSCTCSVSGCCAQQKDSTLMDVFSCFSSSLAVVLPLLVCHPSLRVPCAHNNPHNALPTFSQLSMFCFCVFLLPSLLILFNNICLHACSISSRCLISKRKKIAKRDWPAMYKMFSLCLLRMSVSTVCEHCSFPSFRQYPSISYLLT